MKHLVLTLLTFCSLMASAQNAIIIPPKKDNTAITQLYQKKRQQVVAKQKNAPRSTPSVPTKYQGICISQVVDLGLSVKWAGWNLGAKSTEQNGGYYGWGDAQGINRSKEDDQYPSTTPPGSISGTQYDTARKLWGSNWRMPNAYEMMELYNECKWEWINFKGVYGAKVTGPNGNAIFLPASGYREGYDYDAQNEECDYWTGSLDPTEISGAFCVAVENEEDGVDREVYPEDRHLGFSIRPVYDSDMPTVDLSSEEFKKMGMGNVKTSTLMDCNISAVSRKQNDKWSEWDYTFNGNIKITKTGDHIISIGIYKKNVSKQIALFLVKKWGDIQDMGNGFSQCALDCLSGNPPAEENCFMLSSPDGHGEFVCTIDGVTYDFYLQSPSTTSATKSQEQTFNASYTDGVLTVNGVRYEMVKVAAGKFKMGASPLGMTEAKMLNEKKHKVTLTKNYYLGMTEVTQALWTAVMGYNPSEIKGANLPVTNVSWYDCQTFISKLNVATDRNFRLPTEAEWEFAARGGNNSRNYLYSGGFLIENVAWCDKISNRRIHAVATREANELGIYDMSGNVMEWCSDWYGEYDRSVKTNPVGPMNGVERVCRGGSYIDLDSFCRCTARWHVDPNDRDNNMGLRLALSE